MIEEPWFTFYFIIIPLFAGAINKYYLIKGKKKSEYTWVNYGIDVFMCVQITIYAFVTLINYK